jgi:formate dehydrogenase major subunit
MVTGVPAETLRAAARLYATGGNGAIYYGLGVTEHSQGSTTVMAIANLAMATGNIGRRGVGVNPLRGRTTCRAPATWAAFPHELPGYRHISDECTRDPCSKRLGRDARSGAGLRIPNMLDAASMAASRALYIQGEDISSPIPIPSTSRRGLRRWNASSSTTCS